MNEAEPTPVTPCSDAQLRRMRNAVYPANNPRQIQSDEIWQQIKANWRKDEAWLTEKFKALKP